MQAWWNAGSVAEYWTLWNTPVHHWVHRHVYLSVRARAGRHASVLACFLVSAIAHELLVAVPLHCVKGYAFAGMLAQVGSRSHLLMLTVIICVVHAVFFMHLGEDAAKQGL